MCGHRGCDGVQAVGELGDGHLTLTEEAHVVRRRQGEPADEVAALEREAVGTFPGSVLTLGAASWSTVDRAHAGNLTSLRPGVPT